MRNFHFVILLLAVTLFLFFFKLGDMALTDPDETFYAQTAKEMLNAGEWVTPTIFGKPQFEKPVLYYWFVVASYMVFGVSEFAARFPSVILAIAGVLGVYFLGRLLFSPLCGFFSGLILATCAQYIVLARACVTDMALMTFILFCLVFFLMGQATGKKTHYLISSAMAALAVLTKGPIGLFIPAVVVGLYVLLNRQWKKAFKGIPTFWCVLVFIAICLPWYLAVIRVHGSVFIAEFFGFQNITRFLKPEHRIGDSALFYIPVIIAGFFPWSLFLPLGAWDMYRNRKASSRLKAPGLFLLIWFLTVFLFFSFSRTKLVTYIFPLFPVMALVTGRFWERFVLRGAEDKSVRKSMNISYIIFAVFGILAMVGIFFVVKHEYAQATGGAILVTGVFAVGLSAAVVLFLCDKKILSFSSIVLAVVLLCVPLIIYIMPIIGEFESSKALSFKVKEVSKPGEPLGGEDDHRRGIAFYTDRTDIVDLHPYPDLMDFVSRKERVWCIIQSKHYRQLTENRPDNVSEPLFHSGKYVLITNMPDEGG
ncbi:MAG: glycosyltransferase family 39 protein [Candidatus Omnitrophota bacterium]